MEFTGAKPAREKSINPAIPANERYMPPKVPAQAPPEPAPKTAGYGLPCANCRAYYPADMKACPICKCPERVATNTSNLPSASAAAPSPSLEIDDERELFLKELKSQAFASHTQINTAATFRC